MIEKKVTCPHCRREIVVQTSLDRFGCSHKEVEAVLESKGGKGKGRRYAQGERCPKCAKSFLVVAFLD